MTRKKYKLYCPRCGRRCGTNKNPKHCPMHSMAGVRHGELSEVIQQFLVRHQALMRSQPP